MASSLKGRAFLVHRQQPCHWLALDAAHALAGDRCLRTACVLPARRNNKLSEPASTTWLTPIQAVLPTVADLASDLATDESLVIGRAVRRTDASSISTAAPEDSVQQDPATDSTQAAAQHAHTQSSTSYDHHAVSAIQDSSKTTATQQDSTLTATQHGSNTADPPFDHHAAAISQGNTSTATQHGSSVAAAEAIVLPGNGAEENAVQESWQTLMRWSKWLRRRQDGMTALQKTQKVVVFGGGSFGTAMAAALARQKEDMVVTLLLRDQTVCDAINETHRNPKYLTDYLLPSNVTATTDVGEAISGAQYAVHAVPVQHSRAFLESIKDVLPTDVPIISVSKGVERGTKQLMHHLIPSALGRRQPSAFLSGPSFAKEVISSRPTALVVASKDKRLAREVQELFASSCMRINRSKDVTGVEICGALKNVLAIAAGIVEGMGLGNNALAAVIAQGCMEIRWLAERMGAKPTTVSGLSGMGDIMLTCYGDLSRNRSVGVRLGQGHRLEDILQGSTQVAEGVATAGVVVGLAREYRVSLPVLTAVAHILDGNIRPREAVLQIMALPQIEER